MYSILGVADAYTGLPSPRRLSRCSLPKVCDEIAPLNFDRYYFFRDTIGQLAAAGTTSAKIVQRQAAPASLGGAGALNATSHNGVTGDVPVKVFGCYVHPWI